MADQPHADPGHARPDARFPVQDRDRLGSPLPAPLTSFVGRDHELEAVVELLHRPSVRLITLTGPGGAGKTRLAIQVAAAMEDAFPHGAVFVPLATVAEPAQVLPAIAHALGVADAVEPRLRGVIGILGQKRVLLVLDNFEHVVEAAPIVADLLMACPEVVVLTTSRAPLHVSGENEFPVPPLAVPDIHHLPPIAELPRYGAVTLFAQRARAVRPDFAIREDNASAVAEVCARLDGLPLAIELAAARTKVLSPQAVLMRLEHRLALLTGGNRDQPERLRTMREAIAWSYDLLPPHEQALFRRLAVFAGGFTLDAAEFVAGEGGRRSDGQETALAPFPLSPFPPVLDGITALVDSSLLVQSPQNGDVRFSMLETIREYGLERLTEAGEDETTRRGHAAWCLALAEDLWPTLQLRLDPAQAISHLAPEHDNLRAALTWLDGAGNGEGLLRLAGAVFLFWYVHGDLREGLSWLELALTRENDAPAELRARALLGAGMIAHYATDDARAVPWLEASLALYRTIEDHWGLTFTLLILGIAAEDSGDYNQAATRFAESLDHARAANNPVATGLVLVHLGVVAWGQGDRERAGRHFSEALAIQRAAGDIAAYRDAESLAFLGLLACEQGDLTRSVDLQRESLSVHVEKGYTEILAFNLANVAMLAGAIQWQEAAARLFAAAVGQREAIGNPFKLPERAVYERAIDAARVALRDDFDAAWAAGRTLSLTEAVAEAFAVLSQIGSQVATGAPTSRPAPVTTGNAAGLTARELEVLRLLASGNTNRAIADALFVSPRTVQAHLVNIFTKLDVHTRAAAVGRAYELGLI